MKRQAIFSFIAGIAALLSAVSCGDRSHLQEKYAEIDRLCDTEPKQAMSLLDSIDSGSLSERDRHRYDLLHIKTRDKAYVTHTSDSLVLDVIDYYEKHQKEGLYPEALYYGGRVYSDLGDFPTAIGYFQKSLDVIPDDREHLPLKGNILSQTGHLLEELGIHQEAVKYFEKTVENNRLLNDSVRMVYDNLLLALSHLKTHDYNSSKKNLSEALRYSNAVSQEDIAWIKVVKASVLLEENIRDSALMLIRENLYLVDSLCYNYALANAADIYRLNGIPDTAYMYARELATSQDFNNRIVGYDIIFSKELMDVLPVDTLLSYIPNYKKNIDDYLERYEAEEAVLRHSKYNYNLHVRERKESEESRYKILTILLVVSTVCATLLAITLYLRYRNTRLQYRFYKALNVITTLRHQGNDNTLPLDGHVFYDKNARYESYSGLKEEYNDLLEDIRTRLIEEMRSRSDDDSVKINEEILNSEIYNELRQKLDYKKGISGKDDVLKRLQQLIDRLSPEFTEKLNALTRGKLTEADLELCLLVKCGFTPTNIAVLLNKEKNTISSRRAYLTKKIFGEKTDIKQLDKLILSI